MRGLGRKRTARAGRFGGWRELSSNEQVEVSTRWLIATHPWVMLVGFVSQLPAHAAYRPLTAGLVCGVLVLAVAQCMCATRLLRRALDCYLDAGPPPGWPCVALAGLLVASSALVVWLIALDAVHGTVSSAMTLYGLVAPFNVIVGLVVPRRASLLVLFGYAAVTVTACGLVGQQWPQLFATGFVLVVGAVVGVFTGRSSAWYIAVLRELDAARDTRARLAVAEERLRFGRDLHDVLGRNLSAIALKSELAVQLSERGSADAAGSVEGGPAASDGGAEAAAREQMAEVQRIARESQAEVRAVARGAREAGLATELAGARAILRAADVDCRIEEGDPVARPLPAPVQSALGWVVREGATNVLRHADASRCAIRLSPLEQGVARLILENDGVRGGAYSGLTQGAAVSDAAARTGDSGSGLVGLRERLAALGGTLTVAADPASGTFRLTAEVPHEREAFRHDDGEREEALP